MDENTDAKILNIDKYLDEGPTGIRIYNRIHRIGVELEGGWEHIPTGAKLEHDGSVVLSGTNGKTIRVGEIPSPPLLPLQMWQWIRKNYPSQINETCGFHIHMSFESASNYSRLMTKSYQLTMLHYLEQWAKTEGLPETHPIWDRLKGKNKYCTLDFWPEKQTVKASKSYAMNVKGHRYTAINYCHGLKNNGTLEVRVLPMMDAPYQAIRAAKRVIKITNACLVVLGKREKPITSEIMIPTQNNESSIELIG